MAVSFFFPSEFPGVKKFQASVTGAGRSKKVEIERAAKRVIPVVLPAERHIVTPLPVDIVFVLDTTSSMGEEIARLKNTLEIIEMNISNITPKSKLRFGMVLYKDKGDEYVTKVIPLSTNFSRFRKELEKVEASGGGDIPENLQDALKETMSLEWNSDGIRLAFIITDAPPHLDYGQTYTYLNAMKDAKARGVKFFSVGTGGLDINGEYVLRQIAQYTSGKYIFLTYGEKGESSGGQAGSVSHHTGEQYSTGKLESIIIRFTKEEIAHQLDLPLDQESEYFTASKVPSEIREKTLRTLFDRSLAQLIDYSSIRIKAGSTIAVMPVQPTNKNDAANAEYFGEHVLLSSKENKTFKVVERKNIQKILKELELQQSGVVSSKDSAKIGELVGADLLLLGQLYKNDEYEIYLKLIRVETGEILAITKARIDPKLGLGK
ncbi:MAG: CsgG/HfaB family protein [Turneriella sp.]